ncbi:MAG: iron ABC transporter permease, partial [Acidimicrobiales bacterium]|nr:iron ABC transporter permease [Acidimicrobiales bacterium]
MNPTEQLSPVPTTPVEAIPAGVRRPPASSRARTGVLRGGWTRSGGLVVLVGVLAVVAMASVAYGSKQIPIGTVWDALWHRDDTAADSLIVRTLRVPRTIMGLL